MKKRVVKVNVVQGQPFDGTGIVCIHLFVPDARGPFVEPHVLDFKKIDGEENGLRMVAEPKRGRLACDKKRIRKVAPVETNGVTTVTPRTDDPRAVTCVNCKKTKEYIDMLQNINDKIKNA